VPAAHSGGIVEAGSYVLAARPRGWGRGAGWPAATLASNSANQRPATSAKVSRGETRQLSDPCDVLEQFALYADLAERRCVQRAKARLTINHDADRVPAVRLPVDPTLDAHASASIAARHAGPSVRGLGSEENEPGAPGAATRAERTVGRGLGTRPVRCRCRPFGRRRCGRRVVLRRGGRRGRGG